MGKKRVSTGIPGLDPLIEGGFPQGKSFLITGEAGTGKTIFCIQFILKGLLEGEKAVYVAVDEKPSDILEEAASLGWDLLKFIEQKDLLILDASPLFSSRMGSGKEKEVDVQKTVGDLASYVKRMGAARVVIDPVGPLILSRDSSARAQEHVRTLVHSLQDNMGTTNLLTSYSIPGVAGAG
ncbi:MAG: ATPase domain-containing protein, partial [Candidatus Binatota bacterium]